MSKNHYAFGRLESRGDKVRSLLLSGRLRGLLGAIGAAVVFAVFAGITFGLLERAPSAKPGEKAAAAAERPAPRVVGTSSRPKTDIRRSQAAAAPHIEEPPGEENQLRMQPVDPPRVTQSEFAAPVPAAAPAPQSVFERYPGPPPRAVEPAREELTASTEQRPAEARSATIEEKTWPVVPRQAGIARPESKPDVPTDCLPTSLRAVLTDLQARFGPVEIISTTHLQTDNHSSGSIREKLHQACKAVDIRARDPKEVMAFLKSRPEVGGINSYRNRVVHFDLNANYRAAGSDRAEAGSGGRSTGR